MVKLKWPSDKILLQRVILVTIVGTISCGILHGYLEHYKQVSEYMQSMAYRQEQESRKDYHVKLMKENQQMANGCESTTET